ncbi:MAG: endonuclease Q family protein, partial [Candidatus Aenigmatarchaeota archaeon]
MTKFFADLHIHSRYSRATSRDITLENLEKQSKLKGLNMIGTGDFTHPVWFDELKRNLIEKDGLYHYKDKDFFFLLQAEVANIYEQGGKSRKVHNVLFAPSMDVVSQINDFLKRYANLSSDGRPMLSIGCAEMTERLMSISKDIAVVPAHAWTPWFGVLGSKSGFDSIEECFGDQTKNIFAIETGLSSDPLMNWTLSSLDKFALLSNSDSHSANTIRLGREFNAFDLEKPSYLDLIGAIKSKDKKRFLFTCEVPPAFGKYHLDGHRNCQVFLEPKESLKYNNICPTCGKELTIGVLHRVEELSDRPEGFVPQSAIPYKYLIPLAELLAAVYNTQNFSKKVWEESSKLIGEFGSELNVLLE